VEEAIKERKAPAPQRKKKMHHVGGNEKCRRGYMMKMKRATWKSLKDLEKSRGARRIRMYEKPSVLMNPRFFLGSLSLIYFGTLVLNMIL